MGYPTNQHIKVFAAGQMVKEITAINTGHMEIVFENGERLRLIATEEKNEPRILATPFAANGEVKQSTAILASLKDEDAPMIKEQPEPEVKKRDG